MLPQAVRLSKMERSNAIRNNGIAGRMLPLCPENQMRSNPRTNNIAAKKDQIARPEGENRLNNPEERDTVVTEKITFALPLPAGTLAGVKDALAPGGSPEAVRTTA
jgi:hypothetical protein